VGLVQRWAARTLTEAMYEQALGPEGLLAGHHLLDRGGGESLEDLIRTTQTQPCTTPVRRDHLWVRTGVEGADVVGRPEQPRRLLDQPLRARPPTGHDEVRAVTCDVLQAGSVRASRRPPPTVGGAPQARVAGAPDEWS
jgi:hypothetical protein